MTVQLQSLAYRILIVMAVLLSPDIHAYAETMEIEVGIEEVCCIGTEKSSQERILPKASENKFGIVENEHHQFVIKKTANGKLPKDNLQMFYCVFRE